MELCGGVGLYSLGLWKKSESEAENNEEEANAEVDLEGFSIAGSVCSGGRNETNGL